MLCFMYVKILTIMDRLINNIPNSTSKWPADNGACSDGEDGDRVLL